jgi:hypothetical protein
MGLRFWLKHNIGGSGFYTINHIKYLKCTKNKIEAIFPSDFVQIKKQFVAYIMQKLKKLYSLMRFRLRKTGSK